jgi:hypothetical protein
MLELSARHARDAGLSNVQLVLGDDQLSQASGSFDFVNCYLVLQHIPPHAGTGSSRPCCPSIAVGGIGSMHMTYAKCRKFLVHEAPKAQFYRRDGDAIIDIMADFLAARDRNSDDVRQ